VSADSLWWNKSRLTNPGVTTGLVLENRKHIITDCSWYYHYLRLHWRR